MAREPKDSVIDNVIVALDALSYDELLKVAGAASKLAESKKAEAKQALIAEFMSRAEGLGLSLVEATGRRGRGPSRKGAAASASGPKAVAYRDSNGNTWVGKGPRPAWLREALAAGAALESFKAS